MILLIIIYMYLSFRNKRGQIPILFCVHAIANIELYLKTQDTNMLLFYLAQVLFFAMYLGLHHLLYKDRCKVLVYHSCMLLCLGFVMLTRLSFSYAIKQFTMVVIASVVTMMIPVCIERIPQLKKITWIYGIVGLLALVAVWLHGTTSFGAQLTLGIGEISFQPSEFVKISFVLFVAGMFQRSLDKKTLWITTIMASAHVLVLVLSKDLGSALIFFLTYLAMFVVATKKWLYLFGGLLVGSGGAVVGYLLFEHVRTRVFAWLDPWSDIDNKGYQITQSLFAIGTGGWLGLGLYEGMPYKIPIVEKDFIFAAISEELGGIVAVCLILICLGCFLQFMLIASKKKLLFYKLVAFGLGITYAIQVCLTIGGVIKFIPSTGVTLPFVSYGGSSLVSTFCLFMIMQGLYMVEEKECDAIDKTDSMMTTVSFGVIGIFVAMIGYFGYFIQIESDTVINNSYNTRLDEFAKKVVRGSIYSSDGELLAQTLVSETGEETRQYPYDRMFAHAVGYSEMGKTGIESLANYYLLTSHENMFDQIAKKIVGQKTLGDQVITTLDSQLQQVAYTALGNQKGAVVVMEVKTGKILAMVSKPDYNPNSLKADWELLMNEDNKEAQLLNRATQGLYPPGSTFKTVIALAYLRQFSEEDFCYVCNGSYEEGGYTISCYNGKAHGEQTLQQAYANSCNGAFAYMGSRLDTTILGELTKDLLFSVELPLSIAYNKSAYSMFSGEIDLWNRLQTSIGQGQTQISPMHNTLITAAIANDGVLVKPYFIDEVISETGTSVKTFTSSQYGVLLSVEEAQRMQKMMRSVVTDGTGTALNDARFYVAGKTGSAEFQTGKSSHAWFTGYAPYENPEIVVTVLVEEAGTGGAVAAPIAKTIMDEYFLR